MLDPKPKLNFRRSFRFQNHFIQRTRGCFEMENFSNGTIAVCEAISEATENGAFSLVGEEIVLQR